MPNSETQENAKRSGANACSTAADRVADMLANNRSRVRSQYDTTESQLSLLGTVQEILFQVIIESNSQGRERAAMDLQEMRKGLDAVAESIRAGRILIDGIKFLSR